MVTGEPRTKPPDRSAGQGVVNRRIYSQELAAMSMVHWGKKGDRLGLGVIRKMA